MVKFNTICRSGQERSTNADITKVYRNPNPKVHPLAHAREYQRALVATKVEKIYAQPFLGALNGHSDGVSCIEACRFNLSKLVSGSYDGEIRIWDIPSRRTLIQLNAHQQMVKGVSFSRDGMRIVSSGEDKTINLYDFPQLLEQSNNTFQDPLMRYLSKGTLGNVDHNYQLSQFATAGQVVQVWDYERPKPIMKFQWGVDSVSCVKYSPADSNLICGTSMDRCVILYDVRAESAIHKVAMLNKSQCLAWNPIEPLNIVIGNDDSNCYTYDIRKIELPTMIHKDHISAVMSVAFSSSGREFVSGSFDRTIRIFPFNKGFSREVYHGQRMQQVNSVSFSADAQFVYSGSNDMNIRIWKVNASQKVGIINQRETNATNYRQALKEKFKYNSEIKRIAKHRHLPKYLMNKKKQRQEMKESKNRKQRNAELNNPGQYEAPKPEKQQRIEQFIQ
ncbi:unnamed protein product [Paramecium pentaurelia]|uniref:DDB1- and CUL4-associated factor 13 n=1 Tax=Paramecium pentaurelia TaxID=43138 RepID=A0A8S1VFB7_9CILI|nr:unnamed protein product [Paramecium pentaurelia]